MKKLNLICDSICVILALICSIMQWIRLINIGTTDEMILFLLIIKVVKDSYEDFEKDFEKL